MSVAGGSDLGLFEINEAASLVQDAAHPEANIIFGTVIDDSLGDEVRVTVIAAGFDAAGPSRKPVIGAGIGGITPGRAGRVTSAALRIRRAGGTCRCTRTARRSASAAVATMTTTSTCRPSCATEPRSQHGILETVTFRIRRVTTTRAGGASASPFDTFNLGDHVGDDPATVAANRARLAKAIGLGDDGIVWMNQVHGDRVVAVHGPIKGAIDNADGLVTANPKLALAVVTADCVPVLLSDARAGVVAAVHAGRVGAQKGVVARAVEVMVAEGAHVEDVSVFLGPAVSGRNYEVARRDGRGGRGRGAR